MCMSTRRQRTRLTGRLLGAFAMTTTTALAVSPASAGPPTDWLVRPPAEMARADRSADGKEVVLHNGLIRRVWRLGPNAATVALDSLMTGASLLRTASSEGWVVINGAKVAVGGLVGQPERGYMLPEWIADMKADPDAFRFVDATNRPTAQRFAWKRTGALPDVPWPPPGIAVHLRFAAPPSLPQGVEVVSHTEMYDAMPVTARWFTVRNGSKAPITLNAYSVEQLAAVEGESAVGDQGRWTYPPVYVAGDFMCGGDTAMNANKMARWVLDPAYTSQVNYTLTTPCVLECGPALGPDVTIPPGGSYDTHRAYELVLDSDDRERKGLAVRRMYRALAPWTADNPLMLHLTSVDPNVVKTAIDQAAEVGFEMVIFSFGSGLNMEDASEPNIKRFKEYADYAHSKGLRIGGYSMLASRSIGPDVDVVSPKTGKTDGAVFGYSPCLQSAWGRQYFEHVKAFLTGTGFDLLEHDGSYPGDVCASTMHIGHKGLDDSVQSQYALIQEFYHWCRSRGIYLNVPDWYMLQGSNKTGMGYREVNWSLPRARQIVLGRHNLYDGTWEKTPTMGWMFVPLVQYQGGGDAATIEPLKEHLDHYEAHLANNLGFGAQACYRGPRLFDAPQTKAVVRKWVAWFKEHRAILESDVIHLRRADGRDWDGILHVNPALPTKGLAMLYNPLTLAITREVALPLRYTGLAGKARVRVGTGRAATVKADASGAVRVKVTIPAQKAVWVTLE